MNESRNETIIKLPSTVGNSSNNTVSVGANNDTGSVEASNTQNGTVGVNNTQNGTTGGRRLLEDSNSNDSHEGSSESKVKNSDDVREATVENGEALEADADQSFELFRDSDELADEYSYDYDDYVDESMWGDEEWTQTQDEKLEDYVNIDSHILCTL